MDCYYLLFITYVAPSSAGDGARLFWHLSIFAVSPQRGFMAQRKAKHRKAEGLRPSAVAFSWKKGYNDFVYSESFYFRDGA